MTHGRKLRTHGTVAETNIHHPSDSSLLADSVRVLGRAIKGAQGMLQGVTQLPKATFCDHTRSAKRAARQINQKARQGLSETKQTYRHLVAIAKSIVQQPKQVCLAPDQAPSSLARTLQETLEAFLPRAEQVIDQMVLQRIAGSGNPALSTTCGHGLNCAGGLSGLWRWLAGCSPDMKAQPWVELRGRTVRATLVVGWL
ncbi:MAG: hypothetical protein FJ026_17025 [Chloroflexi bacterium]|nr:hypothetical protein [Chloroflexota bacterium]